MNKKVTQTTIVKVKTPPPPPPKPPVTLKPIVLREDFSLHEEISIKKKVGKH